MTDAGATVGLDECTACHLRFLPTDGPCPRCGSTRRRPYPVPGTGRVVAATELTAPAPGWSTPHRLALVEVADGVRILAVVDGPLPAVHEAVRLSLEGEVYRARAPARATERGEGDVPRARRSGSSFEPPR